MIDYTLKQLDISDKISTLQSDIRSLKTKQDDLVN
jgi:hypothetical protein